MEIKVTKNNVTIQEIDPVHSGEFNVNQCNFTFSETYTNDLVKKAIFTKLKNKTSYEVTINNDFCIIPYEVLQEQGEVRIGVYAYEVDGEDLILRYSPKATRFMVGIGSYLNADDGTIKVPALTLEEYEQALHDLMQDVEASKEQIVQEVIDEATPEIIEYAQQIIDQIPTGTVEGEVINIQDSSNLPIKDFKLKGNTGKNMFHGNPNYSTTRQNVNITINGNRITLNGTSSQYPYNNNIVDFVIPFPVEPSTEYTYSMTKVSGSMTGNRLAINLRAGSTPDGTNLQFNTSAMELLNGSNSVSFTSHTSAHYVAGLQFIWQANTVFDNYTFDIQLEEGSTATEYEPYKDVTGDNTVKVLGKNLLPTNQIRTDKSWLTVNSDGSITIEYDSGSNINFTNLFTNGINIPKGNYKLKLFVTGTFVGGNLIVINENGNVSQASIIDNRVITVTNSNITNLQLYIVSAGTNCTIKLELEQGTTEPISYEPYTEQTQLLSLGDTHLGPTDEIARVNGIWCVNEIPITDTTLKGQLENVLKMHTNKNITNAWIEPSGTNAQAALVLTYSKDLETLFNNLAGTTSVASINSVRNVGTLENTANLNIEPKNTIDLNLDPQSSIDEIDENSGDDNVEE